MLINNYLKIIFSHINRVKVARKKLKNVNKKTHDKNQKWKIGFIVQMPEIWDKIEDVYNELCRRSNTEVYLVVVPSFNLKNNSLNPYGYELDFFTKISNNIILAIDDMNQTTDIQKFNFDYVFYQRPYDSYLPEKLQSDYVANFLRICYIPYADFQGEDFTLSSPFFYNVSYGFMYSEEACIRLKRKSSCRFLNKYQSFYYTYPIFERYQNMKTTSNRINKKIVWTPRWTTDITIGGSHFFDYKDKILDLNKKFENVDIVFRPHPLAFENYVAKGLMTEEDVKTYLKKLQQNNILLDTNLKVEDTFKDADILISDISSVITMFYLTDKPIIYCNTNRKLNDTYKNIIQSLYIANSWEDIERYLSELINGNDYMLKKRKETKVKLFSNKKNTAAFIVDKLI